MARFALLALSVLSLSVTGCRSIDPDLVARTKKELQRVTGSSPKREGPPPPGAPIPVPWNKGQFAVWGITVGEYTTLTEAQVEEADQEGVIVMMTTISPKVRTTSRLTFSRQPHSHAEARDLLTQVIRRRGDERAVTYRFHSDMPADMRDALEPLWATLVPEPIDGAQPETATTPAATMEGCRPAEGRFLYSPLGLEVRALLHPAVPITGLVSARAKSGEVVEVLEMGWSGGGPAL